MDSLDEGKNADQVGKDHDASDDTTDGGILEAALPPQTFFYDVRLPVPEGVVLGETVAKEEDGDETDLEDFVNEVKGFPGLWVTSSCGLATGEIEDSTRQVTYNMQSIFNDCEANHCLIHYFVFSDCD